MKIQSKLSRFAKSTLVVAALAAGFVAPVKAATELNLAILAGIADEDYDGAQVFKNYVETASNGSVVVKIFAGAQLCGSAPECFESMKAGVVDIYNGTAGGASVIYKPIQALDIPYMFSSDRVVQEVLQGPLEQDIRARVKLPPGADEYYWVDLEGLRVETVGGAPLGILDHVFATGANDVLVVRGDRERMIPFVQPDVVTQVDFDAGVVTVDWDPDF